MSEPTDTRKRTAAPRSRGNSPPTQRRRQSEQSSTTDRRNSSRDVLHSHERTWGGAGSAISRRPSTDHFMSPMSNHNGSDTPVQGATTVPSMFPVTQKSVASQSAPMDTLNALRSHKSTRTENSSQATNGPNTMEVKSLKAQLRAAELVDAKLRSDFRQLENRLKQFEDLPAQLAALKSLVEQQHPAAAMNPTLENLERRISVLENAKPTVEAHHYVQLQSDVQATKADIQVLRSTAAQTGKDVAEALALAKSSQLETDATDLTSLKGNTKTAKEPQQAVMKDEIEIMIQTAIEPEIEKMDAYRTEQGTNLKEIMTTMAANHRFCDDLNQRDLPGQLQSLRDKIERVENDERKTYNKVSTFENRMANAQQSYRNLEWGIYGNVGPVDKAYSDTNGAVTQRIGYLEDIVRSLRKELDHLSVNHKELLERVKKLPAGPGESASLAPSLTLDQRGKTIEHLHIRISDLDAAVKRVEHDQKGQRLITNQVRSFQSELSKLTNKHLKVSSSQEFLQSGYDTILKRITAFESEQSGLHESYKKIAEQVKELNTEQEILANQQNAFQTEQIKPSEPEDFIEGSKNLETLVRASEKLDSQHQHVANEPAEPSDRVTSVKTAANSVMLLNQNASDNDVDVASSSPEMKDFQQRLRSVEDRIGGKNGLSTAIEDLHSHVDEMDEEMHNIRNEVTVVSDTIKDIFGEHFDPFKASVEEQMEMYSQSFIQHSEILSRLQEQVAKSQEQCPASSFSAPQVLLIRNMIQDSPNATQDLTGLQNYVNAEVERHNAAVEDLKQQMAMKQDIVTGTQAIDVVKAAVRNLQNQYDNISTDELHQKMAHWFVQHYPTPTANMLQQFSAIQHEVAQLRSFTDLITRIPNGVQALSKLVQIGPQITALVQSPQGSKEFQEMLTKTDEVVGTLQESLTEVRTQHESLARAVGSLQTSLHEIKSHNTPFVKIGSFTALERSISALRTDLEAGFEKEFNARTEFATKASNEHDQRIHAENTIKASLRDLATKAENEKKDRIEAEKAITFTSINRTKELEDGKIKTISNQVEDIRATLKGLGDFNEPLNKELFSYLPVLFEHTGQLQWVLEGLNQNLPRGGLAIEWSYDWKAKFGVKPPFSDEAGEATGNKSKR